MLLLGSISLIGAILLLTYLVLIMYTLYILNDDLYHMDRVEDELATVVRTITNKLSITLTDIERTFKVNKRSAALYVLLTLITLNYFMLYWIYATIFKDLNNHLKEDERIMPILVKTIDNIPGAVNLRAFLT